MAPKGFLGLPWGSSKPAGSTAQIVSKMKTGGARGLPWGSNKPAGSTAQLVSESTTIPRGVEGLPWGSGTPGTETRTSTQLEGSWIRVLKAGKVEKGLGGIPGPGQRQHVPGAEAGSRLSQSDLDAMVRNHTAKRIAIPLGIGTDWSGAKAVGEISELRRQGRKLMGKVRNVHPKLEELHAAGALPRVIATVQNTPDGPSISRVGLSSDSPSTEGGIDKLHEEFFAKNKKSFLMAEGPGARQIQKLKDKGLWRSTFDESGFPQIFELLQGSDTTVQFSEDGGTSVVPMTAVFSRFIEIIAPMVDAASEKASSYGDAALHSRAQSIARERSVSYSEGLNLAVDEQLRNARDLRFSEMNGGSRFGGVKLHQLACQLQETSKCSYGEALAEVVAEHPELSV